jgi:isopenicillin N synthase-like dioxygenase
MAGGVPELGMREYLEGSAAQRAAFSAALMQGLQRYGFIILCDHPVTPPLIDAAYASIARLFAQPEAVKREYIGGARGYAPFGTEHAKNRTVPDLKEFWQIGPEPADVAPARGGVPANIWPPFPEGFKDTVIALFEALQATGRAILEALAPALGEPHDFFDRRIVARNSVLRLLHYPPVTTGADAAVRSAAHEDINLITLLLAPQGPGLELLDRDGRWLSVETSRNNLIVDSGDMLARITNDVIPATTHRVVNPSVENVSRYSMPFFMHPDPEVVLRCLPACVGAGARYPEIRAGTFLEQRLMEIGLVDGPAGRPGAGASDAGR